MRDWQATLWPASFGGFPFFVEKGKWAFGKKVVVHEFPNSDEPFIEEMGLKADHFDVNAYLADDFADFEASALVESLKAYGPAMLVLPDIGPTLCIFETGSREYERDKLGYIGFSMNFVAQGASTPVISADFLAQGVFDALATLAICAGSLVLNLTLWGMPNWVVADVVAGAQDIVATLEGIAAVSALDPAFVAGFNTNVATGPAPSSTVAAITAPVTGLTNAMIALYNAVPMLVVDQTGVDPSVAPGLFALAGGLCSAMAPASAMAAFAAAADALPDVPAPLLPTANRQADAANMEIVARLGRGVLLAGYAQALATTTFAARPDAITARADCVQRFERELNLCAGAIDAQYARGLTVLRDACVSYLSRAIINLKPIMSVSANISLPSLWWAWRLYKDPTRAADLIARNNVAHASFMPTSFEALAP